ncbi:MAG: outer membrane lipoprotein carrier protein LolA [Terriglobia bacterium]
MQRHLGFLLCLLAFGTAPAAAQTARRWEGETVVKRLNEAAKHFRTVTAKLEYIKVTVVVNDKSIQEGEIYYHKNGTVLIDIRRPQAKKILFRHNKVEFFYPKMNQIQEYNLAKHRSLIEQFLRLGFGTSGDDLKKSYLLTVLGESKLGNRSVLHLELTPKDERVRNQIHKIHLWLDLASWAPVQQKFFEVGGDYMTTRYTDIKVNGPIPRSKLRLNAPKNVSRVKPGV